MPGVEQEVDVSAPEIIIIRLFLTEVGDLGIADETLPFFGIGAVCDTVAERLESYARDERRPQNMRPHRAQAIDEDG